MVTRSHFHKDLTDVLRDAVVNGYRVGGTKKSRGAFSYIHHRGVTTTKISNLKICSSVCKATSYSVGNSD